MKPPAARLLSSRGAHVLRQVPRPTASSTPRASGATAAIHSDSFRPANVVPVYGTGPPPEAPVPAADHVDSRVARRRKQAEMLGRAKELRAAAGGASANKGLSLKKRFWRDVHVREVDGAYEVHLDSRPLRRPNTKDIVRLPLSKPLLAHALALEWDLLASAQQATRRHHVPLTSLVCRALDIADDDADDAGHRQQKQEAKTAAALPPIRASVTATLLRYLDTDALLCFVPRPDPTDPASPSSALDASGRSLRDVQEDALARVSAYLAARVWPGLRFEPVLDDGSILPRPQQPGVRELVEAWVAALGPWDLAGLERATISGKGLLGAARLVVEWSESGIGAARLAPRDPAEGDAGEPERFGVDEAAKMASIEVDWQIGRWGEVEDTHDVEREDVRRQLGSVVLLVSGTGSGR